MSDPAAFLAACGKLADDDIDLAAAALALAALDAPRTDLGPYRQHLQALVNDVGRTPALADDDAAGRAAAVNRVLFEQHGYAGDDETYDDLQNADLMRVIDRRRGLPVALGILFIHAARGQGWSIGGVNFPGHFLLQLAADRETVIIDPFHGGRLCMAADLRQLIKAHAGEAAELKPEHTRPAGNRRILLRLQNNRKSRFLRGDKLAEAAQVLDRMLLLAPEDQGLWHQSGMLQARLGNLRAAVTALERLAALSAGGPYEANAKRLLAEVRAQLN